MNKFFDVRTRVMKPLWRRVLFAGFTLLWGAMELASGSAAFGMIFLVAGAYLSYQFFIVFDPDDWDAADAASRAERGLPPRDPPEGGGE